MKVRHLSFNRLHVKTSQQILIIVGFTIKRAKCVITVSVKIVWSNHPVHFVILHSLFPQVETLTCWRFYWTSRGGQEIWGTETVCSTSRGICLDKREASVDRLPCFLVCNEKSELTVSVSLVKKCSVALAGFQKSKFVGIPQNTQN